MPKLTLIHAAQMWGTSSPSALSDAARTRAYRSCPRENGNGLGFRV